MQKLCNISNLHFFRFIQPQSTQETEQNEESIPAQRQFYQYTFIDDLEPVETPDGRFIRDDRYLLPQYPVETLSTNVSSKKTDQLIQPQELDLIKGDVSALSKKLIDIQGQVTNSYEICFVSILE